MRKLSSHLDPPLPSSVRKSFLAGGVGVLLLAGLGGGLAGTAQPAAPAGAAPPATAPFRSPLEGRLKELDARGLTAVQKARLGLRLFRDEMLRIGVAPAARPGDPHQAAAGSASRPAPPLTDRGEGFVALLRKLVAVKADPTTLRHYHAEAQPGPVRDALTLFLALQSGGGTPSAAESKTLRDGLTALLMEPRRPLRLRELAATLLGDLAVRTEDPGIGRFLAETIRTDAQVVPRESPAPGGAAPADAKGSPGTARTLVFPVRRAAVASIRKMQQAGMLLESFVTAAADQAQTEVVLPAGRK